MTTPPPRSDVLSAPALHTVRPLLVTGGAGFIGCNLADRLATEGHDVIVLDALSRAGVAANLEWLRTRHPRRVTAMLADVRDGAAAEVVRDCGGIFHLAAQVAVTASLEQPVADFEVNVRGTLNLLEAIRRSPHRPPLVFASTNKVYGDLSDIRLERQPDAYRPLDPDIRRNGIGESRPLSFHTPYGCSKGAADQYVLDFCRSFGLRTTVLRMSCIYGPRQLGTEDQGWVAHFLISALNARPITVYGDGRQVRDILHVDDAVEAYLRALRNIDRVAGCAFNLGGGPGNAVSLRQVLAGIAQLLGRKVEVRSAAWRSGDQRYYVSDTRRISAALGLPRPRPHDSGLAQLARWLRRAAPSPDRSQPGVTLAQARP